MKARKLLYVCSCGKRFNIITNYKEHGEDVEFVKINWCPECMEQADSCYEEVPVYKEGTDEIIDSNQIELEL